MLTGEKEIFRQEGYWVSGSDPSATLFFSRTQVFAALLKTVVIIISGFQFCPSDPSTVMVTSADSQVRILSGVNVISKFKGEL